MEKNAIIRLRPNAAARAIRHAFPWVYDNELVLDRRSRGLAPGSFAVLQDADRSDLARVTVNPNSRIFARVLDTDAQVQIDRAWVWAKLAQAAALRARLFDAPYYRLVHAEADGLPGVIIDRFGDHFVIQPNAAWADAMLDDFTAFLRDELGAACVIKSASGRARKLEGLDDVGGVLHGTGPDAPIAVSMNGATYLADLVDGQKTGLFYDQRPNHAFVAPLCRGGDVLDVFSHVGGFGLAALAAGAQAVTCVDGSAAALDLAAQGAALTRAGADFTARQGDAFDVLEQLAAQGAQFDVVICDPPAFAPSKKALDAGLRAYERIARLAAPLVRKGGFLALCSCSHAADLGKFRTACSRGIGRAGRQSGLIYTGFAGPDHPMHPQLAESGYLKALVYAL